MRLNLNRPAGSPHTTELHATLIGRDGSAVGLSGEGEGMHGAGRRIPPRHVDARF